MFTEVSELMFPDEAITLGKKIDPQDMPKQEKQEKLDFKEIVIMECESFVQARSISLVSLEADIQLATEHKENTTTILGKLGKLKDTCGGPFQEAIDVLDKQITQLLK